MPEDLPTPPPQTPVPAEYVKAACLGYFGRAGVHWDTVAESDQRDAMICMEAAVEAFVEASRADTLAAITVAWLPVVRRETWRLAADELRKIANDAVDGNDDYMPLGYIGGHIEKPLLIAAAAHLEKLGDELK